MADIQPGRYRHFKGNEYQVLGIGLWVRPASMWTETVERDGYHGPRFIWVAER